MSWGFSWRGRWPALAVTLVATLVPIQASDAPSYDYSCYTFQSNSPGTIVPSGDIIQLVGSSYEAYCLFDPRRVNVDDVYFIKRSRDIRIEEIRHTVVNESAISIQVLEEEPIAYDLRCMMRNHTRDAFLCGRTVRIGYKPADVENFSCISENWQKLNCTWDIPPNPALVTYNLTACPNSIKTTTWCAWEGTDFNIRRNWVLTFTANNKLTQDSGGVSYSHEVDVFKSVIPKALDNLEVEVKSPYEVQLSWYLPHPIDVFTGNVVQEVQYKLVQAGNNTQPGPWTMVERWKVEPGRFERKLFKKAIADLRPYVMYEFQVRLHTGTGPIREHMWSEPATKRIRTPATIPQKAPVTDIGTFMVESSKSRRDIYINWQKVDPLYWNGPDFRYEISVFDGSTNSPIEITPDEMQAAYARFTNMEKEVPFRFEILPVNYIGRADDSVKSTVVVPAMSAMIDYPSFFKVIAFPDEDSITYSARWRLPHAHPDHNIESVTLYWCRQNQYEDRCMTKLEWINVDDPNSLMRNLTGFDKSHRYIFGVSANSHNSSSGISWISCIATYGTTPPPIESFNVTEISSKTIKVKWNLDCKAKAAIPTGFNISYCKKQQLGNECEPDTESYEEIYEETATEYVIKDLHPFTTYSITIASITPLGLSRWSNTIAKTTKPDKPSGPPQNLKTVSRGQNWIQIAMEPPEVDDRNGRIEKYIISTTQPLPAKHVAANTYSHVTYYNRTNLEPNEHYTFMVVACTSSISCGDEESAAVLNETTKIGVPGKIDYIMQDDDKLEWEIEDCNADDCFYELSYTFNGTSHFYRSKPNQVAVSFQELNITCGENSSDVAVVMRAGSLDEDNKTLYGPKMEKTVTCGFGGSYRNVYVVNQYQLPQVLMVQMPSNNQYNTFLDVVRLFNTRTAIAQPPTATTFDEPPAGQSGETYSFPPTVDYTIPHWILRGRKRQFMGNNRQDSDSSEVVRSNSELRQGSSGLEDSTRVSWDGGEVRQQPWISSVLEGQPEKMHTDRVRSYVAQNTLWLGLPFHQFSSGDSGAGSIDDVEPVSQDTVSGLLSDQHLPRPTAPASTLRSPSADYASRHNEGVVSVVSPTPLIAENNEGIEEDEENEVDILSTAINPGNCPLVKLLTGEGVRVQLNASSENFELNIKGEGNFFQLFLNAVFHLSSPDSFPKLGKLSLHNSTDVSAQNTTNHPEQVKQKNSTVAAAQQKQNSNTAGQQR